MTPPLWHHWLAWTMLGLGFASALAIVADELLLGHRQKMAIMNLVHPITALYGGPVWVWVYLTRGREASERRQVANAVSHCGAGCTLGDICGEWLVLALGIAWFGKWSGHQLPEELLLDFLFAWTLGIVFQYLTIAPMSGEKGLRGVLTAVKVDTASILAFQLGLFGWMAIVMLVFWPHHGISIDSPDFWFEMQVGMVLGFFTAWPVNRRLLAAGVKEKMG